MKNLIVVLTLLLLLKPILPVFEYAIDYDYISKVLCINKEKPQLKCNGKCHLMKELSKASKDEIPSSSKKSTNELELLFFQKLARINFNNTENIQKPILNVNYNNLYTYINSSAAFHPPAIIS